MKAKPIASAAKVRIKRVDRTSSIGSCDKKFEPALSNERKAKYAKLREQV